MTEQVKKAAPVQDKAITVAVTDFEEEDFSGLVGSAVTSIMRDRTSHQGVEKQLDSWAFGKSLEQKQKAKLQMETAKQAIEAIYTRFRQAAGI